jgi:ATP-dependent protease ClpP protease subunit
MKQNLKRTKVDLDDDEEFDLDSTRQLGYFVQSFGGHRYTVHINEAVKEPAYYTNVVNMMCNATENDTIVFMLNSPGGMLDGLASLLDAIDMTEARTLGYLQGRCHSAASILALHCDEVFVGKHAQMLCHNVSYGTGGKGSDIVSHVQHMTKISENLMYDTYVGFLSEAEIADMLDGKEIYLDSEQIQERLEKMKVYRTAEFEAELKELQELEKVSLPPAAKKTTKKK